MTIKEVTQYVVVCDEPGCIAEGETATTKGYAVIEGWADCNYYDPYSGKAYCDTHCPLCPGCDTKLNPWHPDEEDHELDCIKHKHSWVPTHNPAYVKCQTCRNRKLLEFEHTHDWNTIENYSYYSVCSLCDKVLKIS